MTAVEKGTLIEYRQNAERRLAVLDRPEGKKNWIVLDDRGVSRSLNPRDFTFVAAGETLTPERLSAFRDQVESFIDPDALAIAWEMLVDDPEPVDLSTLAQLLFSDESLAARYATHLLLDDDRFYFKQRKELWEPRPRAQVEELQRQYQLAAEREQQWQDFLGICKAAIAADGPEPAWDDRQLAWLAAVEDLAVFGDESRQKGAAQDVLSGLRYPENAQGAFDLLVAIGRWSAHENLFLRRSQTPQQFPAPVAQVAFACLETPSPDVDADLRLDLSGHKVYTIDDESTREIDDGLSVERLEDGRTRLWIHIADPSRHVLPGDVIDLEARRRGTTVYLPTGSVPMFPEELATGPMSLVQGQDCCALSFAVCLDAEGGIEAYAIHPTRIRPTYRLTYEDVDEMLELGLTAEQELLDLWEMAQRRQQWRLAQGAIAIEMPESSIKVREDAIDIRVLEESPARQLVAEMMILAGEAAGRYGQEHDLPLPFRGQPQPELPPEEELQALPVGPVRSVAIRRCMSRSEVALSPSRHASLGLDTYIQVTSPIRRYSDLIAHYQIKAHLRGEELPFPAEKLQPLLASTGNVSYEAMLVERQTNRYWGIEYLRRQVDETWQAMLLRWLREDEGLALVLLEDLGLELPARLRNRYSLGEPVWLKVRHADPRQDLIHFDEVDPASLAGA